MISFQKPGKRYARIVTALVTAIIIVLFFIAASIPKVDAAFKLATTHQPERYTVLYFDNSRSLSYVAKDEIAQYNSFHIINYEAKTYTYNYVVTSTYANKTLLLKNGTVTLGPSGSSDISFNYVASNPTSSIYISVDLTGLPNHIFYQVKPL